jgi:hypothetical protein
MYRTDISPVLKTAEGVSDLWLPSCHHIAMAAAYCADNTLAASLNILVAQETLPHSYDRPTATAQRLGDASIASLILNELIRPKPSMGLGNAPTPTASMPMPEATMYKDRESKLIHDEIRASTQLVCMLAEPDMQCIEHLSQLQLGTSIARSNTGHQPTAVWRGIGECASRWSLPACALAASAICLGWLGAWRCSASLDHFVVLRATSRAFLFARVV